MTDERQKRTQKTLNFIRDEASTEDFFGSHRRIASALAGIIRAQSDLKVVGLLGDWGSGKSTVIKLLEGEFSSHPEGVSTFCFYYDAWLHQSDPPRRAFLEELIRFLVSKGLTSMQSWQEKLDRLNRQIEDTETTSTPTLTNSGRWLLASFLLVPFASKFIEHGWYDAAFGKEPSIAAKIAFFAGAAVTALPVFVVAGLFFHWRAAKSPLSKAFWSKANWTKARPPHEDDSLLSLLTNKSVERHRLRVTRLPEPSTIEFQRIFRDIIGQVGAEGRRFIFVVDNLDRLPEHDAVEMWATIRSFFLGADQALRLPTVILPIDRKAVERMYAASQSANADELSKSFMDKTFDLTFHVTKPVVSDWQKYLARQLAQVFGDQTPTEAAFVISSLYQKFLDRKSRETVTPREVNTLINEVGVYWLQWDSEGISFPAIAYYVINRDEIDKDIQAAVVSPWGDIADFDKDWALAIAALHYGAKRDDAAQILLAQPLRAALTTNDEGAFKRLSVTPGFDVAFGRALEDATTNQAFPLANAANLLSNADLPAGPFVTGAWRKLMGNFERFWALGELSDKDAATVRTLLSVAQEQSASAFGTSVAEKLDQVPEAAFAKKGFPERYLSVLTALNVFNKALGADAFEATVAGNGQGVIDLMSAGYDKSGLSQVTSRATMDQVTAAVVQALSAEGTAGKAVTATWSFVDESWDLKWPALIDAAGAAIENENGDLASAGLGILGRLRKVATKEADARIKTLSDNGQLNARLQEAYARNAAPTMARAVAMQIVTKASIAVPDGKSWADIVKERPKFITDLPIYINYFGGDASLKALVSLGADKSDLLPLVQAMAGALVTADNLKSMDATDLVGRFTSYKQATASNQQSVVIAKAAESDDFWTALATSFPTETALEILKICLDEEALRARAATFVINQANALPADRWKTLIADSDPFLAILALVMGEAETSRISGHLAAALRDLMNDALGAVGIRDKWFAAANYLSKASRTTLLRAAGDRISAGQEVADSFAFVTADDNALLAANAFTAQPDGAARNFVLPLIEAGQIENLLIIADELASTIAASEETTRVALGEAVQARWSDTLDDEERKRLTMLQEAWELAPLVEVKPDEPSEDAAEAQRKD